MDVMIPRNSVIPTKKVKMYTTVEDNQDTIEIEVSSLELLFIFGHVNSLVDFLMRRQVVENDWLNGEHGTCVCLLKIDF